MKTLCFRAHVSCRARESSYTEISIDGVRKVKAVKFTVAIPSKIKPVTAVIYTRDFDTALKLYPGAWIKIMSDEWWVYRPNPANKGLVVCNPKIAMDHTVLP